MEFLKQLEEKESKIKNLINKINDKDKDIFISEEQGKRDLIFWDGYLTAIQNIIFEYKKFSTKNNQGEQQWTDIKLLHFAMI